MNFRADDGLEEKLTETVETLQAQGVVASRASVIRLVLRRGLGLEEGEAVSVETLRRLHALIENRVRFAMRKVGSILAEHHDDEAEAE